MERAEGPPSAATAAPADPVWPCGPRRPAGPPAAAPRYVMPASDVREDGTGEAPDFSDSWSAGLSAALEKADQSRTAANAPGGGSDSKPKNKKGRKGKSVLISGGLSF